MAFLAMRKPAVDARDAGYADSDSKPRPAWQSADGGGHVVDKRARDELRRKILEAWAKGSDERGEAARSGRFLPMPTDDSGSVDPAYIQSVMRDDFFPMVNGCYEDFLRKRPDAGGSAELWFEIVGDENLGGIVESAFVDAGGALDDDSFRTCFRESLLSVSFRPPPHGGTITVGYPIILAPDEADE